MWALVRGPLSFGSKKKEKVGKGTKYKRKNKICGLWSMVLWILGIEIAWKMESAKMWSVVLSIVAQKRKKK